MAITTTASMTIPVTTPPEVPLLEGDDAKVLDPVKFGEAGERIGAM